MESKIRELNNKGYQLDTMGETHDPLDGKTIINHYGEPLYFPDNTKLEVNLVKLTDEEMKFTGTKDRHVYEII